MGAKKYDFHLSRESQTDQWDDGRVNVMYVFMIFLCVWTHTALDRTETINTIAARSNSGVVVATAVFWSKEKKRKTVSSSLILWHIFTLEGVQQGQRCKMT